MSLRDEFVSAAKEIFDSFDDLIKTGQIRKKGLTTFNREKGTNVKLDDDVFDARYVPDKPSRTFIAKNGAATNQFGCYLVLADSSNSAPVAGDTFTANEINRPIYEVESDDADAGIFYRVYVRL